jgi:hypothetical protein
LDLVKKKSSTTRKSTTTFEVLNQLSLLSRRTISRRPGEAIIICLLFMLALRQKFSLGVFAFAGLFHSRSHSLAMSTQKQTSQLNYDRFLTYDYRPIGSELKLKDNTEFYGVGSPRSKKGVIILPDLWGWNAGRIRNIADFLATQDCYVALPGLLGRSTDSSETLSWNETSSFGEYMKSQTFDGKWFL